MARIVITLLALGVLAAWTLPALASMDGHGGGSPFEMMDTDKDGSVSRDEYMAAATKQFDRMDADGDGKVTKEETAQMRARMREKMQGGTPPPPPPAQ